MASCSLSLPPNVRHQYRAGGRHFDYHSGKLIWIGYHVDTQIANLYDIVTGHNFKVTPNNREEISHVKISESHFAVITALGCVCVNHFAHAY